jgi:hypothetical protein
MVGRETDAAGRLSRVRGQLVKDSRMVAGGGSCELRLAAHLKGLAEKTPGLEQVGARTRRRSHGNESNKVSPRVRCAVRALLDAGAGAGGGACVPKADNSTRNRHGRLRRGEVRRGGGKYAVL